MQCRTFVTRWRSFGGACSVDLSWLSADSSIHSLNSHPRVLILSSFAVEVDPADG